MNRLQERYENEVVKSLMEKFNYSSKMQAPKIEKIVLNIGVGDAVSNSKLLDDAVNELTLITGQKPVVTRAKGVLKNRNENIPKGKQKSARKRLALDIA